MVLLRPFDPEVLVVQLRLFGLEVLVVQLRLFDPEVLAVLLRLFDPEVLLVLLRLFGLEVLVVLLRLFDPEVLAVLLRPFDPVALVAREGQHNSNISRKIHSPCNSRSHVCIYLYYSFCTPIVWFDEHETCSLSLYLNMTETVTCRKRTRCGKSHNSLVIG